LSPLVSNSGRRRETERQRKKRDRETEEEERQRDLKSGEGVDMERLYYLPLD